MVSPLRLPSTGVVPGWFRPSLVRGAVGAVVGNSTEYHSRCEKCGFRTFVRRAELTRRIHPHLQLPLNRQKINNLLSPFTFTYIVRLPSIRGFIGTERRY